MSDSVEIIVPMMPPRAVSSNGGWSWRERSAARREFRECARLATLGDDVVHGIPDPSAWVTVMLDAEIAWCCGRKRVDDTNAPHLLKSAIDGVADVLWGGEDRHVRLGTITQTRGEGITRLTLREGDA